MAEQIRMPQLSDTMNDGKIIVWHIAEGTTVRRGDVLAEVETDKANLEIESFYGGVLLKILTPAGQVAKVGDIIAIVGEANEKTETPAAAQTAATPISSNAEVASYAEIANNAEIEHTAVPPVAAYTNGSTPLATPETAPTPVAVPPSSNERIRVSPLARKLAEQKNIDLTTVLGSGPDGRIVKRDLEQTDAKPVAIPKAVNPQVQLPQEPAAATPIPVKEPTPAAASATPTPGGKLTELTKMRATIARRMQESVQQSPHFYVTTSVRMDEAEKLRQLLKEQNGFKGISVNHLVIRATAKALVQVPAVNSSMRDNAVFQPNNVNIGIITAIDGGLLIPVVHETDKLSLADLVYEARAIVDRARSGRPSSTDLSGGTFSISNMGMFDVESFTAIINPGQGGILAVSSIREEAVVIAGKLEVGKVMRLTLSVDHRIIDGVTAGTFLKTLKEFLEKPALLLI